RGRFWADRWHGRELATPREVRAAIVYVLGNFRKHSPGHREVVDRYSSAPDFAGFSELGGHTPRQVAKELADGLAAFTHSRAPPVERVVVPAVTWLLRVGWRRHGAVSVYDAARS